MANPVYTDNDKKLFLDSYLTFRSGGYSQKAAYMAARKDATDNNRECPSFNTLINWTKKGAFPAEPETSPEVTEETVSAEPAEAQELDIAFSDAAALKIAKHIIRLYRYRDEKAVDAICDELLPVIGGLD